jgi:hypothetical protein
MKSTVLAVLMVILLTGCQAFTLPKLGFSNKSATSASTKEVADATAGAKALDRMAEINKRQEEERKVLEEKYAKFREELQSAYNQREKIDNENFDRISEINYGIYVATNDIVDIDPRVHIANLKSQENMARLMPLNEEAKKKIKEEIDADKSKKKDEIEKKYEANIKKGVEASLAYEKADAIVKQKEEEKAKLRAEQSQVLARVKAEQETERSRLKKEAEEAIESAKEKQRLEMIGWIIKALGGIGIILLIIGLLMKSVSFGVSGILCLGLAYVAVMVPFWIIASCIGLLMVGMVVIDPKTGKVSIFDKKEEHKEAPKEK